MARWLDVPRHICSIWLQQIERWPPVPRHIYSIVLLPQNERRLSVPRHICSIWLQQIARCLSVSRATSTAASGCHRMTTDYVCRATSAVSGCNKYRAGPLCRATSTQASCCRRKHVSCVPLIQEFTPISGCSCENSFL